MDTTFTPLSQLDPSSLTRLAGLHRTVMKTLLSDLGETLLLRYYQGAQSDPAVIGFCAQSADGQISGWAVGSPCPASLNASLRQPIFWFARQMLHLAVNHPGVVIDLLRSVLSTSDANLLSSGQIELTYIGVAPGSQRKGLGKALLLAFKTAAFQAGYTSIALSVETDNPAAVRLYTHCGFQITKTFREGRFERHRMVCRSNDAGRNILPTSVDR